MSRGRRRSGSAAKKGGARGAGGAKRERSAGGVVFRVVDGAPRYLLIRDSYGHWGFPKGHVERGERPDTAALREVMEETGLRSVDVAASIEQIAWFFRFRGVLIHKRCEFFLMHTSAAETKPQRSEGITACRWATVDEALDLIEYENARAVLRRADEMARARIGVPRDAA